MDDELFAVCPFILHRRHRKDIIVIPHALSGLLSLCQKIIEQVRSDPEDLFLTHAVVDQFVIKAFRYQFQHLIPLLLGGDFCVTLLLHCCCRPHYFSFAIKVEPAWLTHNKNLFKLATPVFINLFKARD